MGEEFIGIKELSDLVGVAPHVLRYWESEFPMLRPSCDHEGRRRYDPTAVRVTERIRHLLYEDKLTLSGARSRLEGEVGALESE